MSASVRYPSTRNLEVQLEVRANEHASGHQEAHIEERAPSNRAHSILKSVHVPSKCTIQKLACKGYARDRNLKRAPAGACAQYFWGKCSTLPRAHIGFLSSAYPFRVCF